MEDLQSIPCTDLPESLKEMEARFQLRFNNHRTGNPEKFDYPYEIKLHMNYELRDLVKKAVAERNKLAGKRKHTFSSFFREAIEKLAREELGGGIRSS